MKTGIRLRLSESLELAIKKAEGLVIVEIIEKRKVVLLHLVKIILCPDCGISIDEIAPRFFFF